MSATQTQPSREAVEKSIDVVVQDVHKRAFLHKLAQCGHQAETAEEEDHLLLLGFKLAELDESISQPDPFVVQQHAPQLGKYAEADGALDQLLGREKSSEHNHIVQAAYALAQDPDVYEAALTIKQAERAQQYA